MYLAQIERQKYQRTLPPKYSIPRFWGGGFLPLLEVSSIEDASKGPE